MEDKNFRLSKDIRPVRYRLRIEADLAEWVYTASEQIEIQVREATTAIILHAVDLDIFSASVTVGSRVLAAIVTMHPEAETTTLQFSEALPVGDLQIDIDFSGIITERLRGFYRSEKDAARYATTQFEAADARRAFPCFDEPEFKARFAITLVVPKNVTAVSNGAIIEEYELGDDQRQIQFSETPPISTYLVAFCIGPFEATPIAETKSNIPVRVVVPKGMAKNGIYARDAHVRALEYLEDYTNIPYPYGKVDAIGIADFEAGAMENPGAITYRLTEIIADPEHVSTHTLKSIFYTAAHELTHMWWGDLVTMAWWDDLWLNESFATFVGYKVTADLKPEWGMWRDFVSTLSRPFSLDALVSTHPISFEVKNAKQASERFDVITYWKGAGVVRMLEGFLGSDVFQKGVQTYLQKYRERNATAEDFWHELTTASDRDVVAIANAWIKEPGHPVVHVVAEQVGVDLKLSLLQERFYSDPDALSKATPQIWPIPLVIKYGTKGHIEEHRSLFREQKSEVILPKADWFFLNGGGSGFYRFVTDEVSQAALIKNIEKNLEPHERLMLLDNEWALLKAGIITLKQFLALIDGYRGETDRAVLSVITEHLNWLSTHIVSDGVRSRFEKFVQEYYGPHHEKLGWEPLSDEPVDVGMKRATVLGAIGGIGRHQEVRTEARKKLEQHMSQPGSLDPNLTSVVTHLSARDGDEPLYDRYLEKKRTSSHDPEEEIRFLMALTTFEHPELVKKTLEFALSSEVREQDRAFLFAGLLSRRHSRDAAWKFIQEKWDDITKHMDPMLKQNMIKALSYLTHEPVATEAREFLKPKVTDETSETIAQVDERLRLDAVVVQRLVKELEEIFNAENHKTI